MKGQVRRKKKNEELVKGIVKMVKFFIELWADLVLIVLTADLLFLYYLKAWYEPTRWIRIMELGFLYFTFGWGIFRACWRIRNKRKEVR